MAVIIVEKGSSKDVGKSFAIEDSRALIGRATPENTPDIALNDEYVSRRHAEISFDRGRFTIRDLNSTNGTALDNVRIEPGKPYHLSHDSLIGLGIASGGARVVLRFKTSPTVSTTRMELEKTSEASPTSWLRIDEKTGEVWVDEKQLILSRKEYDLLLYLQSRAGRLCQRDELISRVWPEVLDTGGVSDAAIDQLVHRLRLKIEPDPAQPTRLVSRKGFGYVLM